MRGFPKFRHSWLIKASSAFFNHFYFTKQKKRHCMNTSKGTWKLCLLRSIRKRLLINYISCVPNRKASSNLG